MIYFPPTLQTMEQAEQLYKNLARTFHPDKPTGSTEIMKAVNAEYELIQKHGLKACKVQQQQQQPKIVFVRENKIRNSSQAAFGAFVGSLIAEALIQVYRESNNQQPQNPNTNEPNP